MESDRMPPSREAPALASRLLRLTVVGLLVFAALIGSGLLLADHLTPKATGAPGHALPVQDGATELDREVQPLLAAHPGRTGVLVVADGIDAFAMRAIAARKAGRSLDLQYYIWHDDLTGQLLAREVHAAAERGVRVRILLDDMNAEGLDPKLMALDAHPNIELRLYNPFRNRDGFFRLVELVQRAFRMTHRMHNKAWIADGRVAVVGGRNIGDEYFAAASDVNFHDLDMLLFGPAVTQASTVFDAFWNSEAVVPVADLAEKTPEALRDLLGEARLGAASRSAAPFLARVARSARVGAYREQALTPHWTAAIRVISDPPVKTEANRDQWLVVPLVTMLENTRRKALVVSPYFVPGDEGTRLLTRIAGTGAFVGVATNSLAANDVPAVHAGYASYRQALLRGGVRLYEIRPGGDRAASSVHGSSGASLHTKAMAVDDRSGFVGSFNLDPRSVNLNTEMGVLFEDAGIAADIRNEFMQLTAPTASYWVYPTGNGLRWLDGAVRPPVVWSREPRTSALKRMTTRVIGILPVESQL